MKKIFALALAAVSTVSMFAAINSQLTIYLDSDSKEVEARIAAGDTYSPFNAGACASYVPMYSNPSNIGLYVQYEGGDFMELNAPELVNVPLVIVTSREAAANQNYELFAEVGANHSVAVYVTDMRPDNGGDPVTFELNDLTDYSFSLANEAAFVEGENSVIADRFVINYTYVIMNGDFDDPGAAWEYTSDFTHNGATASLSLTLDADTWYHFQIEENGNIGANGSAFDIDHPSYNVPVTGWSEQLTLHTGIAGDYTFTWTYASDLLTITFPSAPAPVYAAEVTTNADGWASFSYTEDVVPVENGLAIYKGIVDDNAVNPSIELSQVNGVAAGQGVFVKGEPNTTYHFEDGAVADGFSDNDIIGCPNAKNPAEINGAIYALRYAGGATGLYHYTGSANIPAGKAYIVLQNVPLNNAPARVRLVFAAEDEATAIDNVAAEGQAEKFVENGQIFIRRGNEVYTLQGQIVK